MNLELKTDIIQAATAYMQQHDISQKQAADRTGINISYLNAMLAGQTSIQVKDKPVAIADKWYAMLAAWAGYTYTKQYWPGVVTDELTQTIAVLENAKANITTNIIICPTGMGKSHTIELFGRKHPQHTYVVTVSALHRVGDILTDLASQLNLPHVVAHTTRLQKIVFKLRELRLAGAKPLIILDEAENLTLKVLQMLKGFYDGVRNHASVVLIGTDQLINKLDMMETRNYDGMPQFCRRFRAGRRDIAVANNFAPFFTKLEITDRPLIRLVSKLARNYGELRDYMEPALREADRLGVPLTEELFRQFHYLPTAPTPS
jgi:DNA transposition AAA+ family ATPase